MLDKKSKIFLDFMDDRPNKSFMYFEEPEYPGELGGNDDLFAMIRELEKSGYVETIKSSSGADLGVRLSHKGANRKELRRLEKVERWKERAWGFVSGIFATVLTELIIIEALQLFGQ